MSSRTLIRLLLSCLLGWLTISSTLSQPFLQRVERASSPERIRLVLYYFDTCRVVTTQQALAVRTLNGLDGLAQRQGDDQLRRYTRMLRDTYAKNLPNRTYRQNADLFLAVAKQAETNEDEQIAGVCEHFAGQYFYLSEDYGHAFEYLLSANNRFRQTGYDHIPEIHRYLYELAFNYYHLREDGKVITLLNEAVRYPPFNPNLHIQTHNTLAMSYGRFHNREADRKSGQYYQKAYQLAVNYQDSVWIGIVRGNLGKSYAKQGQWKQALEAYQLDYRLVMRSARMAGYPLSTAVGVAEAFYKLGQLDSCRYYLDQTQRMYRLQTEGFDYSKSFQDDLMWQHYYEVARQYYETMGNLPLVARCADSLLVYQARIDKRYRSKAAAVAEQRLLIQQHQAEVEDLRKGSQAQRLWLGLGVGLTALMALWLGWLYRNSQRKRHHEAHINAERQQQLNLEKQQATVERDQARADLARFMKRFGQAETTNNLTEARLLTSDDWAEFRQRFERVHPFFFEQLRAYVTGLTPAEERFMALSKLRIDTTHMGQMLGISPASVRTTKYRLRKRLGAEGQSSLAGLLE